MSGFFTHNLVSGWKNALSGHITIEFQSNINGVDETLTPKQSEEIIKIIKSFPEIKSVKKLQETDILKILEPWLNSTAIPDNFPFPTIFDIETEKSAQLNLLELTNKLSKISQGVRIHDHVNWCTPIIKISNSLFSFAIILSVLIFATVCATVIFITRKTLSEHMNTVKILQLIGANNSYIASQFKHCYFIESCLSSLISILCSFFTIGGIIYIFSNETSGMAILKYTLQIVIVPLIATVLVVTTSKNTVLFFLKNDKWIN
ncbi:MAG: hypothetical protein LBE95_03030 [Holosporaceae bacterium]|nr:hypothetical protein [Holosporaceae bacterium]